MKVHQILISLLIVILIPIIVLGPGLLIYFMYCEPVTYWEKYASLVGLFASIGANVKLILYLAQTIGGEDIVTIVRQSCRHLSKKYHNELLGDGKW